MTPAITLTRSLSDRNMLGALMLGAALALVPLTGHSQTAPVAGAPGATPAATDATAGTVAVTPAPEAGAAPATAPTASTAPAAPAEGTVSATTTAAPAATATATTKDAAAADAAQAAATLKTADGAEAGSVTLSDTPSGALHVIMQLSGLAAGQHAVHIHETGKCEAPSFESAGGHLTGGKEHGALAKGGMHTGDLPNMEIAEAGTAAQEFFIPATTLADVMDGDGAAFVVHTGVDDYMSQPSGNAGDRLACGVFEATKATN